MGRRLPYPSVTLLLLGTDKPVEQSICLTGHCAGEQPGDNSC